MGTHKIIRVNGHDDEMDEMLLRHLDDGWKIISATPTTHVTSLADASICKATIVYVLEVQR